MPEPLNQRVSEISHTRKLTLIYGKGMFRIKFLLFDSLTLSVFCLSLLSLRPGFVICWVSYSLLDAQHQASE